MIEGDLLLQNKHILVIGASSGIGRETAIFASKLGAKLTILARRREKLEEVKQELIGNDNLIYPCDITDLDKIGVVIRNTVYEQGKIDGMVYFAGGSSHVPLKVTKPSYAMDIMKLNFLGFLEVLRCISSVKFSNDGASFVGMSSNASMRGEKGLIAYSAAKGAMNSAIRCAAAELAGRRIRVNGITTGYICETEGFAEVVNNIGKENLDYFIKSKQPFGVGRPKNIADVATFLLSDRAEYITGTIVNVDGGYML